MSLIYPVGSKRDWFFDEATARSSFVDKADEDQLVGLLEGPPIPPPQAIPWLAKTCVELVTDEWDAAIVVTGMEGVSKSTYAFKFALEVMDLVGRTWSFDHLCYSAREVLRQYRTAERGDVIWLDEGARGLWSDDTLKPEQRALLKALTLVRETGAILVVCAPDIWNVAKKFRGRRARFWAHIDSRGTRRAPAASNGRFFERDNRLHFVPTDSLGMYPSRRCPTVSFEPFALDDPRYVEYRRVKKAKLDEFYDETDADLDAVERRRERSRRPDRTPLSEEGDAEDEGP